MKGSQASALSFAEQLQQQTRRVLEEGGSLPMADNKTEASSPTALKSSATYQHYQEQKRVDNFIDIALNQTPENPGPLNPEILAIRLLKSVRDLSPEYLRRYVSYFETLQCLEKAGL